MKIFRRGASADFGENSIDLNAPAFSWNREKSCINLKISSVKDFSTNSRHNYTVCLSLSEVRDLLQAISDAANLDPAPFAKGLESSLKQILRIQSVVVGTVGQQSVAADALSACR